LNKEAIDFMGLNFDLFKSARLKRGFGAFLLTGLCWLIPVQNAAAQKKGGGSTWDKPVVSVPATPGRPRPAKLPLLTLRWQMLSVNKQNQEHAVDTANQTLEDGDWARLGVQINQDGYVYIINHTVEQNGRMTPPTLISKEQNKIPKNTVIEMPTIGTSKYQKNGKYWWRLREPAGREVVTVIFSRNRIDELAAAAGQNRDKDVVVKDSLIFDIIQKSPSPSRKPWSLNSQRTSSLQGIRGDQVTMVWNPDPRKNEYLVERIEFNHK
jgi:hypothetical protein